MLNQMDFSTTCMASILWHFPYGHVQLPVSYQDLQTRSTENIVVLVEYVQMYSLAFPLGFVISFSVFYALNMLWPLKGLQAMDDVDIFGLLSNSNSLRLGIAPDNCIIVQDMDCKDNYRVEDKDMGVGFLISYFSHR
jgi:hypothetical protein